MVVVVAKTRRQKLCCHGTAVSFAYQKKVCREKTNGLVGKVHLTSQMSVEEIAMEIWSVFGRAMGGDPSFPFKYLQATGGGS